MKKSNKPLHADYICVAIQKCHNLGAGGVAPNKAVSFDGVSKKRIKQAIGRKNRAIGHSFAREL